MKVSDYVQAHRALVIEAAGGMSDADASAFIEGIYQRIDEGLLRIVINCENVDLLSSFDLGILAQLQSRIKMKGGEIKVCALKPFVQQVFSITSMDRIFDIHPDLETALRAFGQPPRES